MPTGVVGALLTGLSGSIEASRETSDGCKVIPGASAAKLSTVPRRSKRRDMLRAIRVQKKMVCRDRSQCPLVAINIRSRHEHKL